MSNPILVEVTRGGLVESRHAGALAIARPDGTLALAIGDVDAAVFPRSAIKALQALPLVETGAAEAFRFANEELALACASHSASPRHVAIASRMLARAGQTREALGCGSHLPLDEAAAHEIIRRSEAPSALHNNCSGKHSGMVATAAFLKEPVAGYWQPDHPVQRRIHAILREMTGQELGENVRGTDGCSVPTWAMPLKSLAAAFARFISGEGLSPARQAAAKVIAKACMSEPELVAGKGRACTLLMEALKGAAFIKTGAEGVFCAALPNSGLGIALKIDDGAKRASEVAISATIGRLIPAAEAKIGALARPRLSNWRGTEVGMLRPSRDLLAALDRPIAGTAR
ncbi:MAG: asparaginase [Hyphomicrobiaceae bacterium]|nr:MAG: asparaginase [Hyphomicrobiaceae bacterium]